MGLGRPQGESLSSKLGRTKWLRIQSIEGCFFPPISTPSSNKIVALKWWKPKEAKETIVTHNKKGEQKPERQNKRVFA